MFCYNCGKEIGEHTIICNNCGAKIKKSYNLLSLVGFICSFILVIPGLVCSVIGFLEIQKTNEKGKNLALAGIIISSIFIIVLIVLLIIVLANLNNISGYPTYPNYYY